MPQRLTSRRATMVTAALAAMLLGALPFRATLLSAFQGPTLVRGNAPGEWRYWAADAWSTRYSPLDQINASNFKDLEIAWQWKAGAFGNDEYYRTTPIYASGRLFTVATTRRNSSAASCLFFFGSSLSASARSFVSIRIVRFTPLHGQPQRR